MIKVVREKFTPLLFLASLGAGGLSVSFFAILNYTVEHGKGLIKISQIHSGDYSVLLTATYYLMEAGMVLFAILHIVLSVILFVELFKWIGTESYKKVEQNPLTNSSLVTPFISAAMTMNVMLSVVRYFVPAISDNLQSYMLAGLVGFAGLWFFLLKLETKLLKISFVNGYDVNKINFGWLLRPFALAMVTVTGAGIAALAQDSSIAHASAFMVMVSGSLGFFLLMVKLMALFKSHFAGEGLADKQFLPSYLIVVPNITLYALIAFRMGHYLEKQFDAHLVSYFMVVPTLAFAFEVWYMVFGLSLLKEYFAKYFKSEFHVSQWGFVCPLVAFTVLGTFVYAEFVSSIILFWILVAISIITAVLIIIFLIRQLRCFGFIKPGKIDCI